MHALVKFMFVFLFCKLQVLIKLVQGCNLLLQVTGTEPMRVAKLAMV